MSLLHDLSGPVLLHRDQSSLLPVSDMLILEIRIDANLTSHSLPRCASGPDCPISVWRTSRHKENLPRGRVKIYGGPYHAL